MRRFVLVDGTSDKFWQIEVEGDVVTVHYGRSGTNGQVKAKTHASAQKAQQDADKQIASKLAKGYVETSTEGETMREAEPVPAKASTSTKTSTPAQPAPAREPAPAAAATPTDPPADDLGWQISATELAALPGAPGVDFTIPAGTDGPSTVANGRDWISRSVTKGESYWADHEIVGTSAFEGLPDRRTAAFWEAWGNNVSMAFWVNSHVQHLSVAGWRDYQRTGEHPAGAREGLQPATARARLMWATDAALDPDLDRKPPPGPDQERSIHGDFSRTLPGFMDIASTLVLEGHSVLEERLREDATVLSVGEIRDGGCWYLPTDVPALRALVAPNLSPATREVLISAARNPVAHWQHRLKWSALVLDEAEHVAYVRTLGELDFEHFLNAVVPISDEETRREFLDRLPDSATVVDCRTFILSPYFIHLFPELISRAVETLTSIGIDGPAYAHHLLRRLTGTGAVPWVLKLTSQSRLAGVARAWCAEHRAALASYDGPLDAAAAAALAAVVREIGATDESFAPVHPVAVAAIEEMRAEAALPVFGSDGLPQWWLDALAAEEAAEVTVKLPRKAPGWWASVPPFVVAGSRLSETDTWAVVSSAIASTAHEDLSPRPLVRAVREQMTPQARDRAGWGMLDTWLKAGAVSKEKVFFQAAGFLGADGLVDNLTPLVRAWPGESQHARAVTGLNVLASTGVESALQAISGIANKSKFKGVKTAAGEALDRLAALRGMSRAELEDRVIPDGGLDERGQRVLDFGPRQFRVTLDPAGKASVRLLDAEGRPTGKGRPTLPAANSQDDPELAAAAKKEFAVLKKQLAEVASVQSVRLARAMVTRQTWTGAQHRELYVAHPVMNPLIQPLVWTVLDGGSETIVRVNEEREYLTIDEEPITPSDDATIMLAHPLLLSDEAKAAWAQQLSDYELVAPFEQLDRATYALPDRQPASPELIDLPQGEVNPGAVVSVLEREGWVRATPEDAGVCPAMLLKLPAYDVTVQIEVTGIWTGMVHESGPQRIEAVTVFQGVRPDNWAAHGTQFADSLPWTGVDPIVVSETRRAVALLEQRMES